MEMGLKGKVALVTGSSRGIGRGIALALAAEGCDVMLTGRDAAALDEVAAAIRKAGRRAGVAVLDLREQGAAEKLIEQTKRELGGLDILVNNAGATKRGDFLELDRCRFRRRLRAEILRPCAARARRVAAVEGTARLAGLRSAAPAARKPTAEFTIGSSVNAAVAAFTKCLADRGKDEGVQVNCIHPSVVETDRTRRRIKARMESTGRSETGDSRRDVPASSTTPSASAPSRTSPTSSPSSSPSAAPGCTAPPSISTAARFRRC